MFCPSALGRSSGPEGKEDLPPSCFFRIYGGDCIKYYPGAAGLYSGIFRGAGRSHGSGGCVSYQKQDRIRRRTAFNCNGCVAGTTGKPVYVFVRIIFGFVKRNLADYFREGNEECKHAVYSFFDSRSYFNTCRGGGRIRMEQRKMILRKGSMTVETALIMPVVLSVILTVILFLLYLYNRSVMNDAAILASAQVMYSEKDDLNGEIVKQIKEKCEASLSDRLIGMDDLQTEISVGKLKSSVTITGKLRIAEAGFLPESLPFQTVRVNAESERIYPAQFIRTVRKGKKIKEWITERNKEINDTEGSLLQTGHESELSDSSDGMLFLPGGDVLSE